MDNMSLSNRVIIGVRVLSLVLVIRAVQYMATFNALVQDRRFVTILAIMAIGLLDLVVVTRCSLLLGRAAESKSFCAKWPYNWVAHPAYLTYIILDLAFVIANPSVWMFSGWFVLVAVVSYAAWQEELLLLQKFGDKAKDYLFRVWSLRGAW